MTYAPTSVKFQLLELEKKKGGIKQTATEITFLMECASRLKTFDFWCETIAFPAHYFKITDR